MAPSWSRCTSRLFELFDGHFKELFIMDFRFFKAAVLIAACAISTLAAAHAGVDAQAHPDFFTGFTHPMFGLDHLAAMVAVGVWSALTARRAGRELLWGPLGFANLLLVGAMFGLEGVALPAVE